MPFLSFPVYYHSSYAELVTELAEESMSPAVAKVQALPHYTNKGEVCIIVYKHSLYSHYV